MRFFCKRVGEKGTTVCINIHVKDDTWVDELKESLADVLHYTGPRDKMKVFPAKATDTEWLKTGTEVVDDLKKGEMADAIKALTEPGKELQGEETLQETLLKGIDPPSSDQIHVLVVLPKDEIHEMHAQTELTKRKFSHLEMNVSEWVKIADELNIKVIPVDTPVVAEDGTGVDPFDWKNVVRDGQVIQLTEEQQGESYRKYVERNIGAVLTNNNLCVIGVEKNGSIFNAKAGDIELTGSTDLLILRDIVQKDANTLQ